jgi:hypothetical protein
MIQPEPQVAYSHTFAEHTALLHPGPSWTVAQLPHSSSANRGEKSDGAATGSGTATGEEQASGVGLIIPLNVPGTTSKLPK